MYYVYILKSKVKNKYYIGYTSDVNQRLKKHNNGSNKSTKNHKPWKVIYTEQFTDKASAWKREQQIKRYKGGIAFKKLIGSVA